jgi:hypothetical protein
MEIIDRMYPDPEKQKQLRDEIERRMTIKYDGKFDIVFSKASDPVTTIVDGNGKRKKVSVIKIS